MVRTLRIGLGTAILWFNVDQITKWWALQHLTRADAAVTEFLNLVLVRNTGVTFGMLSDVSPWVLLSAMVGVLVLLLATMARTESRVSIVALGLVAGGASGNIADPVRHAAVTDFLDVHVGQWHWPAFNAADIGIVCGVAILLLDGHIAQRNGRERGGRPR
jgi:signal peptidase II